MILKPNLFLLFSIFLLFFLPAVAQINDKNTTHELFEHQEIKINGIALQVELAKTPKQQEQGLMFRKTLSENAGMLFVFDQPQNLRFWMKNTSIALDIAFLDEQGIIINIEKMTPFDTTSNYSSSKKAKYALELNQGWFETHKISVGDKVAF